MYKTKVKHQVSLDIYKWEEGPDMSMDDVCDLVARFGNCVKLQAEDEDYFRMAMIPIINDNLSKNDFWEFGDYLIYGKV